MIRGPGQRLIGDIHLSFRFCVRIRGEGSISYNSGPGTSRSPQISLPSLNLPLTVALAFINVR